MKKLIVLLVIVGIAFCSISLYAQECKRYEYKTKMYVIGTEDSKISYESKCGWEPISIAVLPHDIVHGERIFILYRKCVDKIQNW